MERMNQDDGNEMYMIFHLLFNTTPTFKKDNDTGRQHFRHKAAYMKGPTEPHERGPWESLMVFY